MWNYVLVVLIIITLLVIKQPLARAWNHISLILKNRINKKFKTRFYSEFKKIKLHTSMRNFHFSNIELFKDRLNQVIQLCERFEICFCLMILEINNFEDLKKNFQKKNLKTLFLTAKNRLKKILRKVDTVMQIDKNSFLVLLPMKYKIGNAAQIAHRMQIALVTPFLIENKVAVISSSIGIAIYPDDGINVDELLQSARKAVHMARKSGENRYCFHELAFQRLHHHESIITSFLQQENITNSLKIRVKTYINKDTQKLEYIHLIPAIKHAATGLIDLSKYPHAVSDTGKALEIFENILDDAIYQLSEWKNISSTPQAVMLPITINQFQDPEFTCKLVQWVQQNKINTEQFIFDISTIDETFSLTALNHLIEVLNENNLKISLGIFLFSQLPVSHISKLPIKILKIDSQILHDLITNKDNISIIKMITAITQDSNITLIAERHNSESESSLLKELNCKIIYECSVDVAIHESSASSYKEKLRRMQNT